MQERIVCLYGAIDDSTSASIVSQLLWLEADNPEKPITLYINSPGGMISSGEPCPYPPLLPLYSPLLPSPSTSSR